jgi:hypothetical protein
MTLSLSSSTRDRLQPSVAKTRQHLIFHLMMMMMMKKKKKEEFQLTCPLSSSWLLVSFNLSNETTCFVHCEPLAGESG